MSEYKIERREVGVFVEEQIWASDTETVDGAKHARDQIQQSVDKWAAVVEFLRVEEADKLAAAAEAGRRVESRYEVELWHGGLWIDGECYGPADSYKGDFDAEKMARYWRIRAEKYEAIARFLRAEESRKAKARMLKIIEERQSKKDAGDAS